MEAYLEHVKDCTHKLAAAGSMIEEEDLIFPTLNGLPSEFNTLKNCNTYKSRDNEI